MPSTLAIDIETYSSTDLIKCGVYKYTEDPDFTILLFAYSFDNNPVHIIDLAQGENIPGAVMQALEDPAILKTAYNANFERTCLSMFLCMDMSEKQWQCTAVKGGMLGLPMHLAAVAKVLKLDAQKDAAGKALIKYFSCPCKPSKVNGERTRNLPEHAPDKWQQYKDYCVQDVTVEKAVRDKIAFFNIPQSEIKLWELDQRINDGGILLDTEFMHSAIYIDVLNKEKLMQRAIDLTGLTNPNSAAQLKDWLSVETDSEVASLTKEAIPALLKITDCEVVTEVLKIRQELSKTSVKKYEAMHKGLCQDNKVRGLLQFYGANRTGRWAGRLVQVQNLPRNYLNDLDLARQLVKSRDAETLEMLFGNVPDTLSQLVRTTFIASPGARLIVADFSAIEARVIAWLAGEKWRLDVFATHGKIYEASAAQMFKVPIESITKGSDLRQKGKVSELALGYAGGANALEKMGALKMGIAADELPKLVRMWRNANAAIVKFWKTVEDAAIAAVVENRTIQIMYGIRFFVEKGVLFIELPSGRRLAYCNPKIKESKFGNDALHYEGMNQTTKQWCTMDTYGGKLVENIVQAVARDCLAVAMLKIDAAGYSIVMHVHDEVVLDVPEGKGSLADVDALMGAAIDWAPGLPLNADSYETYYYKKD